MHPAQTLYLDTLLALRSIARYLRALRAPSVFASPVREYVLRRPDPNTPVESRFDREIDPKITLGRRWHPRILFYEPFSSAVPRYLDTLQMHPAQTCYLDTLLALRAIVLYL